MILAVKIRLFRLSPIIFLKKMLCKDEFSTRLLTFVPELAVGCWLLAVGCWLSTLRSALAMLQT